MKDGLHLLEKMKYIYFELFGFILDEILNLKKTKIQ